MTEEQLMEPPNCKYCGKSVILAGGSSGYGMNNTVCDSCNQKRLQIRKMKFTRVLAIKADPAWMERARKSQESILRRFPGGLNGTKA